MTRSTPIWNAARLAALRARGDDGSPAEVIAVNREILELDPHDMAAANRLGRALQDSGDLHGALAVFRAALERHPDNQIAARRIKDITGHIPPGRSRPRTEQRSPRMRPATDAELVEHRRQAEGLWTVAEAVQVCSDYRQSRHDPRIAVIYGEWATTLDQRNAVAWTARAAAHRNARQVTEAVSAAQESVTLEPDVGRNPHGHTTLLAALVDSGPPPQDLTERLEALGEDKFAQNAAGRALAALGELERAEACFRRAIAHGHRGREPLQGLRELVGEYRARGDERSAVRLEGYLAAIAAPASA